MGILACTLAFLVLAGAPAGERRAFETTLQDDAALLHAPPSQVDSALRHIRSLGVDRVRLTASWSTLAPDAGARIRPGAPFVPTDSSTYPQTGWRALDHAVRSARQHGLDVQIDVAFFAPRWAVTRASRPPTRSRYAPDPAQFAQFTTAVAQRYNGDFTDPALKIIKLPAVRLWTTWNEPNNDTFLQPQWRKQGKRWIAAAAHVYRAMHEAAYDALKGVNPANKVLIGGTAATGSRVPGKGSVPPLRFIRELACVDDKLKPLTIPDCKGYRPLRADGYAHHPYSRFTTPGMSDPDPNDAPIADVGRLADLLYTLAAQGRIAQKLPLYLTEYGYETNGPDPFARFTPKQQAEFVGWSTYLAWRDPRVKMFAQFLARDIPGGEAGGAPGSTRYWSDLQTGLFTADWQEKPAAAAWRLPFWAQVVERDGARVVLVFGANRSGPGRRQVRIERLDPATGDWLGVPLVDGANCGSGTVDFLTGDDNYFLGAVPFDGVGTYRMVGLFTDKTWRAGAQLRVDPGLALSPGARPSLGSPRTG